VNDVRPKSANKPLNASGRQRQFHFARPIAQLGAEEIHQYQLHLVQTKRASWSTFNQADCGLRFLYEVSLGRSCVVKHIPFGKGRNRHPATSHGNLGRLVVFQ
jgi:hypothetical protein